MSFRCDVRIDGVGLWGPGLTCFDDLVTVASSANPGPLGEFAAPKPEAIPPKERRRAGLMINLAVEAAHQACEHAGVDKAEVPSIFVSSMGDTDITDYMCRKLAQPEKLLSPTKFHNSVHNAPAGYWSISAANRAASTFAGSGLQSTGMGLLEAASMATEINSGVLLVGYDIANRPPFADISPVGASFAFAVVVHPADYTGPGLNARLSLEVAAVDRACTDPPHSAPLRELTTLNPAAQSLALLERLALGPTESDRPLHLAAGPACQLNLTLQGAAP